MTYEMRMKNLRNEAFYDGKAEGKFEATLQNLKSLMTNSKCSIDKAMDMLHTPQ